MSATLSNGVAPSFLLEVDSGISTVVAEGGDHQPELQRSVSDNAQPTSSNVLLMQTACVSSTVSLMHDLSLFDVTKL